MMSSSKMSYLSLVDTAYHGLGSGLPGPKKIKKAKFGHKQFQKRPNPEK
jgi:hypothetical protein